MNNLIKILTKEHATNVPAPVSILLVLLFFTILGLISNGVLGILNGDYAASSISLIGLLVFACFFYGLVNLRRWVLWFWLITVFSLFVALFFVDNQLQQFLLACFNLVLFLFVLRHKDKFKTKKEDNLKKNTEMGTLKIGGVKTKPSIDAVLSIPAPTIRNGLLYVVGFLRLYIIDIMFFIGLILVTSQIFTKTNRYCLEFSNNCEHVNWVPIIGIILIFISLDVILRRYFVKNDKRD